MNECSELFKMRLLEPPLMTERGEPVWITLPTPPPIVETPAPSWMTFWFPPLMVEVSALTPMLLLAPPEITAMKELLPMLLLPPPAMVASFAAFWIWLPVPPLMVADKTPLWIELFSTTSARFAAVMAYGVGVIGWRGASVANAPPPFVRTLISSQMFVPVKMPLPKSSVVVNTPLFTGTA